MVPATNYSFFFFCFYVSVFIEMFAVIDLEQNCWHCVRVLFPGHARRVCYTTGSFQQQVTAIDEKRSGFCYSARSYIIICRRYLLLFFIHTVIMHMHSNVRVRMVCVHRTKGYPVIRT
ncbi:uncharacterized protein LOC112694338 [Sipha flava]|uniref:Uncharacterized protein LOC112694338 n=1 Tax=Sipha flava TaxID=143950 RepID=A0A8B8GTF2_9HEMI|nr:uncharacterized protein LOC112694338 [Sipha flava]